MYTAERERLACKTETVARSGKGDCTIRLDGCCLLDLFVTSVTQ